MSQLISVVYMSTKSPGMSENDIENLLTEIRPLNEKNNLSGLLLYGNGTFIQCLEGDEDKLVEIYDGIKKDPRHHSIIELARNKITTREFKSWSMAYSTATKTVIEELSIANWSGDDNNTSTGRALLSTFWKLNTVNPLSQL